MVESHPIPTHAGFKNLTGKVFERLTVVSFSHSTGQKSYWNCVCKCGKTKTVRTDNLQRGITRSCGCLHLESVTRNGLSLATHGHTRGKHPSAEYEAWGNMIGRCSGNRRRDSANYKDRGITVCQRWLDSFENFLADMGPRPSKGYTIERKNNEGNYTTENCEWATRTTQNRNKRSNHWLTFNGRTMLLIDWARELRMSRVTLIRRLERGWSVEKTLTTPPIKGQQSRPI